MCDSYHKPVPANGRLPLLLAGGLGAALPGHQLVITSRVDPNPFEHMCVKVFAADVLTGGTCMSGDAAMVVVGFEGRGFLYKTK